MDQEKLIISCKDNSKIAGILFKTTDPPNGVLIGCHGFGEHSGSYGSFASYFNSHGYACIFIDQRGHGEMFIEDIKSREKLFGIITNYDAFLDDIDAVREKIVEIYGDLPIILYGHSMGGNIALNYLLKRKQNNFCGAVIETPWLRLYAPQPGFMVALAKGLGKLSRKFAIKNPLNTRDITRDREKSQELDRDNLYHNRISFRLFSSVSDAGKYALDHIQEITIPVFLACALQDKIVSAKAIQELGEKAGNNVELKQYPLAYHSIHTDNVEEREHFFSDIIEFSDRITGL